MEIESEKTVDYLEQRITQAHDKFVRMTMANKFIALEFFSIYLPPDIFDAVKIDSLELESSSFITEKRKRSTTDLLYSR